MKTYKQIMSELLARKSSDIKSEVSFGAVKIQ